MPGTDPTRIRFAQALSAYEHPGFAAEQIVSQISDQTGPNPDLVILFVSGPLIAAAGSIAAAVRRGTNAGCLLAVTASGVLGGVLEFENRAGVSALAATLPGVSVTPLTNNDFAAVFDAGDDAPALLAEKVGCPAAMFVVADPYSVPLNGLVPALGRALNPPGRQGPPAALFGGVASGADKPGGNTIVLDDRTDNQGVYGVALAGPIRCDLTVSQGCRPVGENVVVTRARGNLLLELGGRPALEVMRNQIGTLNDADRKLLAGGLFIGRVIDEYKQHLGRGDYLIRGVLGADEQSGGVAVADIIPPGRTVRLHLRDAHTAEEDLGLLLDAQTLHGPPAGAILVTCAGRGERFFGKQNLDTVAIQRAFLPAESGPEAAKSGRAIDPHRMGIPLAGFFAAGEIGPVGNQSFVHSYTACLGCFRTP